MKITVTLDYLDGSKSKSVDMYADEFNGAFLVMRLATPGVAGITITTKEVLRKYLREKDREQDETA